MTTLSILGGVALFGAAASARTCTNVTVPVNINARQGQYDIPKLQSNFDAVTFALNATDQGRNFTDDALIGFQDVTGTYNISAKYCRPDTDTFSNPTVQVLSHGIGFDKSYWDLPINAYNYSYTDNALSNGYHTVAIDRFGIGNSSHADPVNVVQANAEISALYEVTMALRNGTFPTVKHAFRKVVHVGHSFGSAQTYALSALHPDSTDGIALTGFSMNGTWLPRTFAGFNFHLARLNQPLRFGNQKIKRNRFTNGWFGKSPVSLVQGALQL
jgi:pimeloyl-ACP methyl ester carboxylesterase